MHESLEIMVVKQINWSSTENRNGKYIIYLCSRSHCYCHCQ